MPEISNLQVVIGVDNSQLDRGLSEANTKVSGFGSAMTSALGTAAVAGAASLAVMGVAATKLAGDLQQSVANISTIKPEIDTSAVFGALNEMSTRIPATAAELGDSLYNVFSSMDVGQADALALVETFAKGAAGAGTSAETFGTAAMGVMNAYGLSAKDASAISDMFFDTINKGVVTGDELAASLGPVTQSAKAAGVEWRDLGPMIAAVTKEGGPAAQNMNNLNNLFQKFTTSAAQLAMNKMGIATTDAAGKFRAVPDVLTDLKAHLATLTQAEAAAALQQIFPDAQARIGAQTLMSQIDFVNEALKTNQEASGSTAAAYEKMSATFNSQSKLLINNLMAVGTAIGAEVLPMITPLISAFSQSLPAAFQTAKDAVATVKQVLAVDWAPADSINPFVNAVGKAAVMLRDTFGPAITAISSFITGTLVPAIKANIAPIAAFVAGFLGAIAAGGALSAAVGAVAAVLALLLSPLGLVTVAVGLLAAAWVTDFMGIQETTAAWWAVLQPILAQAVDWLQDRLGAALTWLTMTGWPLIIAAGQAVADWIVTVAIPAFTQLVDWLGPKITAVVTWITETGWPALVTAGLAVSTWITTVAIPALTALVDWLGPKIVAVATWISETGWPALVTAGLAVSDWITDTAIPALTTLVEWLGPKISAVVTWLKDTGWPALVTAGNAVGVMVQAVIKFFQDLYVELDKRGVFTELGTIWDTLKRTGDVLWGMIETLVGWFVKVNDAMVPVKTSVDGLVAASALPALATAFGAVSDKASATVDPVNLVAGAIKFAVDQVAAGLAPLQRFVEAMDALSKIKLPSFNIPSFGGGGADTSGYGAQTLRNIETMDTEALTSSPGRVAQVNQMKMGLSNSDAKAACGPAALDWFRQQYGRNPDAQEALKLAKAVGWTAGKGMAGPASFSAAATNAGIPNTMTSNPSDAQIDQLARSGQPFAISTGEHYYQVQGGSAQGLNVGASGAVVGGGPTMSIDQIRGRGYPIQAVIVPDSPAPPPAENTPRNPSESNRIPLGLGTGTGLPGGPLTDKWGAIPLTMEEITKAAPVMGAAVQAAGLVVDQSLTGAGAAATTQGALMVSATADSAGNVTRIYTEQGQIIATTVTNTTGQIVGQWSATGSQILSATLNALGGQTTAFQDQSGAVVSIVTDANGQIVGRYAQAGAAIVASTTATNAAVLTSVGASGALMITASTDALGNVSRIYTEQGQVVATTVTNTTGQIVSQWSVAGEQVVSATLNALGGQTTIFQDQSGQMVAVVTDATGQVVGRYAEMAADTTAATVEGNAAIIANVQATSQEMTSQTTDQFGNVMRIYQDANGQITQTISDASGKNLSIWKQSADTMTKTTVDGQAQMLSSVKNGMGGTTAIYKSSAGEIVTIITDASGKIISEFKRAADGAKPVEESFKHLGDTVKNLKPPDLSGFVSEFKKVEKAANKAADAIDTVEGKGGKKSGGGKDNVFGKAAGGPVPFGQPVLVGEEGPEMFTPFSNGTIIPNSRLSMGGGDGGTQTIIVEIRTDDNLAERIFLTGRDISIKRGTVSV